MRETVKDLILDFMSEDNRRKWIAGGIMERELSSFYKPSSVGRCLRKLAEEGTIKRRDSNNKTGYKFVEYRLG